MYYSSWINWSLLDYNFLFSVRFSYQSEKVLTDFLLLFLENFFALVHQANTARCKGFHSSYCCCKSCCINSTTSAVWLLSYVLKYNVILCYIRETQSNIAFFYFKKRIFLYRIIYFQFFAIKVQTPLVSAIISTNNL